MRKLRHLAAAALVFFPVAASAQRVAIYTESYQSNYSAMALANGWTVDFWNAGDALLGPISTYDALVVGWRGDISTFAPLLSSGAAISAARGSRTVVTGQDPDFHHNWGAKPAEAGLFIQNSINWILAGTGLGIYVMSDYDNVWMNQAGSFMAGEVVITEHQHMDGVTVVGAHAVHTGLTSADMSGWGNSVHNTFSSYNSMYTVRSTANHNGQALTLTSDTGAGVVPEPASVVLMASGLVGVAVAVRRRRRND